MSNTNKKVLIIVFIMLSFLSISTILNVWYNFIDFGKKNVIERSESIAESVRDGLTTHMILGQMDKRDIFLNNMLRHQNVKNLRLIRSQSVINQFGLGHIKPPEYTKTEQKVLESGKIITKDVDTKTAHLLNITIPYTATKFSNPDCLSCHINVKEGDVLGAISMELDMSDVRNTTFDTIEKIVLISLVFLIIAIVVAVYFIKPYIELFDSLEEGITRAYKGDFTYKVKTKLSDEVGKVAHKLNDLSEIFRFKRTIELDKDKKQIYTRIKYILENNLHLKEFLIFESSILDKKRKIATVSSALESQNIKKRYCSSTKTCRAFRTKQIISSSDFHNICDLCHIEGKESICLPFDISEEDTLNLLIYFDSQDELIKVQEIIPIITYYVRILTPVLQTKILMDKLQEKSLKDPMTGLYNRRFLDNHLEDGLHEGKKFSAMMIDVDFFKQVNDNYGHDVGDEVIKGLAQVLKNNIKGSDLAARFGGEEFLLITYNTSIEVAQKIAENIREEFSKKSFKSSIGNFSKTISIGISSYLDDSKTAWETVKYADVALYNAKETGRNKVVIFKNEMYKENKI